VLPSHNPAVDAEDIVCLLFTGGTTGTPKAAQISYRMIAWNTLNTLVHEVQRGDITLTHTPMFHTGGLFVHTLPVLTVGGTVVIMRKWTAEDMLALIEARARHHAVLRADAVPDDARLAQRFAATSFASVRFLTSGGAPLPVPIVHAYRAGPRRRLQAGLRHDRVRPRPVLDAPRIRRVQGRQHRPAQLLHRRARRRRGRPASRHRRGRRAGSQGPLRLLRLLRHDAAATAAAFDADGWFHTGDLARADADGFFFIVDRKKDMFISGGENVYPVEIEKVLYDHPAVAQCAVVPPPTRSGARSAAPSWPCAQARRDRGRAAHPLPGPPRPLQDPPSPRAARQPPAVARRKNSQASLCD
jgi:fatty-acyl-CoA synthase